MPAPTEASIAAPSAVVSTKAGRSTRRGTGRRSDGSVFPQEVSVTRVAIGRRDLALVIVRNLSEQGLEPGGGAPDQFGSFVVSDSERFAKVIRALGIRAESL